MKKTINFLNRFLPHINFIFSLVLLTLFVTDRYNHAMAFLNNEYTKWMLFAFCITVMMQTVCAIIKNCYRRAKR